MTIKQINKIQNRIGLSQMQEWILSGAVWGLEGTMGRMAMHNIEVGACYLPDYPTWDYWGNRLPSRDELKPGSKGTLQYSKKFYSNLSEDEIYSMEIENVEQ